MKTIEFNNFRKFSHFNPVTLNEINFLVGPNNSGKSTLVKAFVLLNNFLESGKISKFSLSSNTIEDANIVTFGRAKNKLSSEPNISFTYQVSTFKISISISGSDDDVEADVYELKIYDLATGIGFNFKPRSDNWLEIFRDKKEIINIPESSFENIETEIFELMVEIKNWSGKKSDKEYLEMVDLLNKLRDKKEIILKEMSGDLIESNRYSLGYFISGSALNLISDQVEEFLLIVNAPIIDMNEKSNQEETDEEYLSQINAVNLDKSNIQKVLKDFKGAVSNNNIIYIGSNPPKQSALFLIKDRNNGLAQAIHQIFQLKILKGEAEDLFIKKWMKKFEIGEDFEIKIYAGEGYEFNILNSGKYIPLSDYGMGTIQLMFLILKISGVSRQIEGKSNKTILLVEEPEINLHPKLQTQLAEFFHDINKKFGIQFIIETHSEYLIRATQLLVKNSEYEVKPNVNPFSVIYFNSDSTQWKMNYREDGKFIEEFGKGFYDESSLLTLDLL